MPVDSCFPQFYLPCLICFTSKAFSKAFGTLVGLADWRVLFGGVVGLRHGSVAHSVTSLPTWRDTPCAETHLLFKHLQFPPLKSTKLHLIQHVLRMFLPGKPVCGEKNTAVLMTLSIVLFMIPRTTSALHPCSTPAMKVSSTFGG